MQRAGQMSCSLSDVREAKTRVNGRPRVTAVTFKVHLQLVIRAVS